MEETVKKFIENNKLTFEVGSRNSDATILCGFINYFSDNMTLRHWILSV